jgi:hypothetical protein
VSGPNFQSTFFPVNQKADCNFFTAVSVTGPNFQSTFFPVNHKADCNFLTSLLLDHFLSNDDEVTPSIIFFLASILLF